MQQNVVEGKPASTITIEMPDTSTVTVDIPEGSGLTYDATTKQITGTPTVDNWGADEIRTIQIPVKVVDAQGATVKKTVELTVYRDTDGDGKVDFDAGIVDPETGNVLVEGDLDDDGDGYSDTYEIAAGTDPKEWDAQVSDAVETSFGVQPKLQDYVSKITNIPEGIDDSKVTIVTQPDVNKEGLTQAVIEIELSNDEKVQVVIPVVVNPKQPADPGALDKVIPVGSNIDSPIPDNYVRVYFAPTDDGWLKYNPTFNTGTVIAFDVLKGITWADAVANGLEVPTATHVDPSYTFDKWSLASLMSGDTVFENTTEHYYYFVASYKRVADTIGITGEAPQSNTLATIFIVLGVILVIMTIVIIIMRKKSEQDKK